MRSRQEAPQRVAQRRCRARSGGDQAAALVEMLRRPKGATIAEIVEANGWQAQTVRGAFAGALKKGWGSRPLGKTEARCGSIAYD